MARYKPLEPGEPRGDSHGEPRDDGLNYAPEHKCWYKPGDVRVCGAKTTSYGETYKRCRNQPLNRDDGGGNGRCRLHGGRSPAGANSPHTVHGRYSKYLPQRLRERYEAFAQDPELVALRDDIAVIDVQLAEKMADLDRVPADKLWQQLKGAYDDLMDARRREDGADMVMYLKEIGWVIENGQALASAWKDIHRIVEQKRRLVDTESRRTHRNETSMTAEEAALLVTRIADTVLDVFDRYDVPQAAQADITDATYELLGPPSDHDDIGV